MTAPEPPDLTPAPNTQLERHQSLVTLPGRLQPPAGTALVVGSDLHAQVDARGPMLDLEFGRLASAGLTYDADEAAQKRSEYRRIRRHLFMSLSGDAPEPLTGSRVVAVTSAMAGEGKTYTSMNITRAIADQFGQPVLLVDADMSNATLSRALGVSDRPGVSDILSGLVADVAAVVRPTSELRVAFLPAGMQRSDIHELLVEARLRRFLARLADIANGGIVVLDCASVLMSEDASQFATVADKVVLVVRAGETLVDTVREAVDRLDIGDRLLMLLNAWQPVRPAERDYSERYQSHHKKR